jgi:hypothetical protein
MKNNKGFAITSIIYAMLILFLGLIFLILGNLASRKAMFDKEKNEILSRFNGDDDALRKYKNGEVVYFDVTTGEQCSNYTETQSNTGTKSGCMKFYAFNDDGKDTVNLILDHNTTAKAAWITKEDYIAAGGEDLSNVAACQYGKICSKNKYGPLTLLTQLKNDTKSWVGTKTPSNYTMDQTGQTSNAKYTIDYSSYKARLITAQEIAKITGNTPWNEKTAASYDYYFFDSKTDIASTTCKNGNTTGCSYGWLYDRTNTSCIDSGCLNNSDQTTDGYWTSSSFAMDTAGAWYVQFDSIIRSGSIIGNDNKSIGVRPVIEVLKSKLSSNNNTENTELCTLVSGKAYEIGSKYECELGDNDEKTFFVLETNGDNVSLIMNKNIDSNGKGTTSGNTVAWCKSGNDNSCAADGALEYLKTSTTGWTKLTESQISLPSYDHIYKAAGNKTSGLSTWLYGNLHVNNSAPHGYWTSTPRASYSNYAWYVYYGGSLNFRSVDYDDYGVRPVITVSKSQMK